MNGHGSAKKHHGPVADRAKLGHAGASRRGRVLYTKIRATKCRVLAIVESHQLLLSPFSFSFSGVHPPVTFTRKRGPVW